MNTKLTSLVGLTAPSLVWQTPPVTWKQLFSTEQRPHSLIVEGAETVIAQLYHHSPLRIVEAAGTWTLVSSGLLSTTRQVVDPENRHVAELHYHWGSISLRFHSGQTYSWKKGTHWEDQHRSIVLTFSRKWNESGQAHLTIGEECQQLPELLLLAGLGWHLILQGDESAAIASTTAAIST